MRRTCHRHKHLLVLSRQWILRIVASLHRTFDGGRPRSGASALCSYYACGRARPFFCPCFFALRVYLGACVCAFLVQGCVCVHACVSVHAGACYFPGAHLSMDLHVYRCIEPPAHVPPRERGRHGDRRACGATDSAPCINDVCGVPLVHGNACL